MLFREIQYCVRNREFGQLAIITSLLICLGVSIAMVIFLLTLI